MMAENLCEIDLSVFYMDMDFKEPLILCGSTALEGGFYYISNL